MPPVLAILAGRCRAVAARTRRTDSTRLWTSLKSKKNSGSIFIAWKILLSTFSTRWNHSLMLLVVIRKQHLLGPFRCGNEEMLANSYLLIPGLFCNSYPTYFREILAYFKDILGVQCEFAQINTEVIKPILQA